MTREHSQIELPHQGLIVQDLYKSYDGKPVVNGVSFELFPGEVVGLLGPNGAGKTTAFYMVIGLIKPDSGAVYFRGKDISLLPMHERARRGLGYLPQESSVFKDLSVEENMFSVLEFLDLDTLSIQKEAEILMKELGILSLAKKKAGALSGGERRRLEIARSLALSPKCLMLDEPFANIDPIAISDVKSIIAHLKEKGISVLITDHNAREIISIVDRSYLIADGRSIFSGTVEELLQNKESKERYFGSDFIL